MRTRKEIEQKIIELKNFLYDTEQRINDCELEQCEIEEFNRISPRVYEDIDALEWVLGTKEVL